MIDITKDIRTYLLADSQISSIIGDKIYPVTIKQLSNDSTTFDNLPQIVIERNLTTKITHDGIKYSGIIDVNILTINYADNVTLTDLINNRLASLPNYSVQLQAVNETYIANAFIQKLTYNINS